MVKLMGSWIILLSNNDNILNNIDIQNKITHTFNNSIVFIYNFFNRYSDETNINDTATNTDAKNPTAKIVDIFYNFQKSK